MIQNIVLDLIYVGLIKKFAMIKVFRVNLIAHFVKHFQCVNKKDHFQFTAVDFVKKSIVKEILMG